VRRKKRGYFKTAPGAPQPLTIEISRRIQFGEADVMGIAWHGGYPTFFEEASAKLGRETGLSYQAFFENQLRAPIVQLHVDYFLPLHLDEKFTVRASLVWDEGARLNTEFVAVNAAGQIATAGYTVQMFTDAETGEPLILQPKILVSLKERWQSGELKWLQ
jgi:acyl-CoA thioester hydrolase